MDVRCWHVRSVWTPPAGHNNTTVRPVTTTTGHTNTTLPDICLKINFFLRARDETDEIEPLIIA